MKTRKLDVCPNCGLILQGPEFLTNVPKMPQQIGLAFDPIAGRFLCPKCNFSGCPIEVDEKDYKKIVFENKPLEPPLARANPNYLKALLLSVIFGLIGIPLFLWLFSIDALLGSVSLTIVLALMFYVEFMMPKYRK